MRVFFDARRHIKYCRRREITQMCFLHSSLGAAWPACFNFSAAAAAAAPSSPAATARTFETCNTLVARPTSRATTRPPSRSWTPTAAASPRHRPRSSAHPPRRPQPAEVRASVLSNPLRRKDAKCAPSLLFRDASSRGATDMQGRDDRLVVCCAFSILVARLEASNIWR